jgi:hypothetical protein
MNIGRGMVVSAAGGSGLVGAGGLLLTVGPQRALRT